MEIQYNSKDKLGEGGFGSVFFGRFNGHQVAVKRVDVTKVNDNEEKVLKQLDHPNIIKLFHSEIDADEHFKYFALELCDASLDQLFLMSDDPRKYKGPKLPHHFTVFLHLALGLEYIHSEKIIHRDIKPENVLISVDSAGLVTMKWADFGLSRSVNERGTCTLSGIKGTLNWFAPELLESLERNPKEPGRGTVKSDVFALALVFGFLLLGGQHLYGTTVQIPNNILKKEQVNMEKIKRSHYSRGLLSKMLADEPGRRISTSQVVIELKSIEKEISIKGRELRHLCQEESIDLEKMLLLIQQGIDVNGKDDNGWNALHFLCRYNSSEKLIDAIQLLIQLGIDVNEKSNKGWNALHFLCSNNSNEKLSDVIKLLIQLGIDVNENIKDGGNALHLLCSNNSSEKLIDVIQLLIQLGIDVNEKDNDGRNALHYLCANNSSEELIDAIQLLIQLGIDKNGKDNDGWNAFHFLCSNNSSEKLIDAIKLLIQHGIDVNGKDDNGCNALHFLCRWNSSEKLIDAIKLLIQLGIDKNGKDNDGWNALHFLCSNNSSEKLSNAIQLLIQLGIDKNEKDNEGWNALHFLCSNNSSEKLSDAIQLLIQHGIEVNSNEIDARSLIRRRNNQKIENIEEIIQLLDRAAIN